MPATPRRVEVEEKDLSSVGSGGAYASLEVPADYEAVLMDVSDYDKRAEGKSHGWQWIFHIEGLPFSVFTSFSQAARWKLVEVLRAFRPDTVEAGINEVDPNLFIGESVGAHVDFRFDPTATDPSVPNFREIKYLFTLPPEGKTEDPPII